MMVDGGSSSQSIASTFHEIREGKIESAEIVTFSRRLLSHRVDEEASYQKLTEMCLVQFM